jgi:hypothetical protein
MNRRLRESLCWCWFVLLLRSAEATYHAALIFPPLHSLRCFERFALSTFFVYMLYTRWRVFSSLRAQAVNLLCSSTRYQMMRPQALARRATALSARFWFWPAPGSACWGVLFFNKTLSSRLLTAGMVVIQPI